MAQLDSAAGFYPDGCRFESCRGRVFAVILTIVLFGGLTAAFVVLRSDRGGPAVNFGLDDDSLGVPHDFGDGLRRINLDGPFVAQLVASALIERGVDARANDGGGGMLGGLDAPAYVVYPLADEGAALDVVADVTAEPDGE